MVHDKTIFERQGHLKVDLSVEKRKISGKSRKILKSILNENPRLREILETAEGLDEAKKELRKWAMEYLHDRPDALDYYYLDVTGSGQLGKLDWRDFGAIRILDYVDYEGCECQDFNLKGMTILSSPIKTLWLAVREGTGGASAAFFRDMYHLFRQFTGDSEQKIPTKADVQKWMDRHPSGLDPQIIKIRAKNRDRIIRSLIKMIDSGSIQRRQFKFEPGMSYREKQARVLEWWNDRVFHLQFAARTPERINNLLDNSLDDQTLDLLFRAQDSGIPFFVNPYYLSLLNVKPMDGYRSADQAIRDYVFISEPLVDEFGSILAWEKEDIVRPGEPNYAGWILPHHRNIHRRYPEVAILIPDTIGRACGGLCVSCQRMYDFQSGHLNFDLEELKPVDTWWERLAKLMHYFEEDSQLRDILITGGDALMSANKSLKRMLDEIYKMAVNKIQNNQLVDDGEKFAEMLRIRLGTRLPVYLPQRVNDDLIGILSDFKARASKVGFKQFVIQTHFESAMEVTPEAAEAVRKLISAGWTITNQLVFTAAASRRGHTAKLRKVLNDIGILTYYTFVVKGYKENSYTYANVSRAVQEQMEEKVIGSIPPEKNDTIKRFPMDAENMVVHIESLRQECNIPFLATDRNMLNLPGVGKSLTYRTIGITVDGRRILEFDHDQTRTHSPIIHKMGKVIIIESKSISDYLDQLEAMGEDSSEYNSLWGYSIGETEERMAVYEYPDYPFNITDEMTNLDISKQSI